MLDALLAEFDALGVTLGERGGKPYLRFPPAVTDERRRELLLRVLDHRDGVIAHYRLAAPAEPGPAPPDPEEWECVTCGRDITPDVIPLLAGPAYCSNGDGSVTKTVRDAEGVARVPVPICPFKGGRR